MQNMDLREKLNKLPENPGVYLMKGGAGEIIYVGKAKNLRRRVRQYFQSQKNHTPKTRLMVSNICDFEYITVSTEVEAFVLEATLIKDNRPKYNILLKDDKQYPYIKITDETYPRLQKVRRILKDGGKYYGPYPNGYAVSSFLETIEEFFHLRTCSRNLKVVPTKERPCLYKFTGKCCAPCSGELSAEEYDEKIREAKKLLSAKNGEKEIESLLKNAMDKASSELNFERAALYRDRIESIKTLYEEQKVVSTKDSFQDYVALSQGEDRSICQIFFVRHGKIMGREYYVMENTWEKSQDEILGLFLQQFYFGSAFIPNEIITELEPFDSEILLKALSEKKGQAISLTVPKKGIKDKILQMVKENADLMLERHGDKFLKEAQKNRETLNALKNTLGLESDISRIEAFDISHIQGVDTVGGMVVFENAMAKKSDYRRFKINTSFADDYASMTEMLNRRFSKLLLKPENSDNNSFYRTPDVILMDGGRIQVNAAKKVLEELGLEIPVVGMVKNEFHQTRGLFYEDREYRFDEKSDIFRLIYKIQEEVHRFAISFHRSLRDKRMLRSSLDEIPYVGKKRKQELMGHFKSIEKIKTAKMEELLEVKSMDKRSAKSLYDFFHRE